MVYDSFTFFHSPQLEFESVVIEITTMCYCITSKSSIVVCEVAAIEEIFAKKKT